jgi:hypothetical protein
MTTRRRGARPGRAQPGNRPSYDPDSGQPWRVVVTLQPDRARKLLAAFEAAEAVGANLSVSEIVGVQVERMTTDENGAPTWLAESPGPTNQLALGLAESA